MGYIDINAISFVLPDGRPLLDEVTFRVGEGSTTALIGPNGAGKSTLLRIIRGDERAHGGAVSIGGGLGVMDQFVGHGRDGATVHDLLIEVAPRRIRDAALELEASEVAIIERDDTENQLRYASALSDYADAGGYEQETVWDRCTVAALGLPFERARFRDLATLSGGEQKRLVLEALLRGPDEVLLLDEPDNYLDVPGKRWLEKQLRATPKTVLLVSHDRELLARGADRIVTLETGVAGSTTWVHGGGFATYHAAREDRMSRLDELRRRWDEEHAKIKALVAALKVKATASDEFASRYRAAQTRLAKFEEAGPPEERPPEQDLQLRLRGARTGKRAVIAERLELTGLMKPFDAEIWFGDRVAVLGSNGSGKSHFLRLLARGGTDPDARLGHLTTVGAGLEPVAAHRPRDPRRTRACRAGSPRPTGIPSSPAARCSSCCTAATTIGRACHGMPRARALDRYGLVGQAQQAFETLSGGQQARFQILLLELSGTTLLLLDEPTDNLDLASAEALEEALARFEGTVLAVTHDRWFARSFDRFLVFGADGDVYESDAPVWDETRVVRAR